MSDLISTPSQTHSTVSNDAFEALIDLLTSDGIDENPSNLPNVSLRDPSGKLDFDKIRLMFASQNVPKPLREEKNKTRRVQFPGLPHGEGDSDDEPRSHRSSSSAVPSRSNSMSPKLVEQATTGHKRSSTFGNQPWVAIHGSVTEAKTDVPSMQVHRALSFDELNTALVGAHEEVKSLRQKYGELQALAFKRLTPEVRDQVASAVNKDKAMPDKGNGRAETRDMGSQAQPNAIGSPILLSPNVPIEIANLSENEAKRTLSALTCALNLSPNVIDQITNPSTLDMSTSPRQNLSSPSQTRQHDVASIARALKFVGTVDELVWRRTSAPSGPRTLLPVYSEENIVALLARLELWERAVRRSSRF